MTSFGVVGDRNWVSGKMRSMLTLRISGMEEVEFRYGLEDGGGHGQVEWVGTGGVVPNVDRR